MSSRSLSVVPEAVTPARVVGEEGGEGSGDRGSDCYVLILNSSPLMKEAKRD